MGPIPRGGSAITHATEEQGDPAKQAVPSRLPGQSADRMANQPNYQSYISLCLSPILKDLEDEMAEKLAGPETERGGGTRHACMRMAN